MSSSRRRLAAIGALAAAVLALLLAPAAGAAELLEISSLSCAGLSVRGTGLPPARNDLAVTVANADNDRTLLTWPARTTEGGELRSTMHTSLTGLTNVRVTVLDGTDEALITTERKLPTPCLPRALPNTGAWQFGLAQVLLLLGGLALVASGLVTRQLAGGLYRGRHEPSWRPRRGLGRIAGSARR